MKNEPDDGGERIEEIEDELCLLWDVTSEESVQSVLVDYSVHQILIDAVLLTNCPRFAVEDFPKWVFNNFFPN